MLYPVDPGFLVKVIHLGLGVFTLLRFVVFINVFGMQCVCCFVARFVQFRVNRVVVGPIFVSVSVQQYLSFPVNMTSK